MHCSILKVIDSRMLFVAVTDTKCRRKISADIADKCVQIVHFNASFEANICCLKYFTVHIMYNRNISKLRSSDRLLSKKVTSKYAKKHCAKAFHL